MEKYLFEIRCSKILVIYRLVLRVGYVELYIINGDQYISILTL